MKLAKYLKALRECPDELVDVDGRSTVRLTSEYGVYDNYPILFDSKGNGLPLQERAVITNLVDTLRGKGYSNRVTDGSGIFLLDEATRELIFRKMRQDTDGSGYPTGNFHFLATFKEGELARNAKKHLERQRNNYDAYLSLHIPKERGHELPLAQEMRKIADRIEEISELLATNGIPLCLNHSQGWNHNEDLSRIVYYTPRTKK